MIRRCQQPDLRQPMPASMRRRGFARIPVAVLLTMLASSAVPSAYALAAEAGTQAQSSEHLRHFAQSENAQLARLLVPVPGYRYVDPWSGEPHLNLPRWRAAFEGHAERMSWHSIVSANDAENTTVARHAPGAFTSAARMPANVRMEPEDIREVGFLGLVELKVPVPADELASFLQARFGGRPIDGLDINGTHVHVFERSREESDAHALSRDDYPNSRYWYAWERAGNIGAFDGADRVSMERWLRAYLSRLP